MTTMQKARLVPLFVFTLAFLVSVSLAPMSGVDPVVPVVYAQDGDGADGAGAGSSGDSSGGTGGGEGGSGSGDGGAGDSGGSSGEGGASGGTSGSSGVGPASAGIGNDSDPDVGNPGQGQSSDTDSSTGTDSDPTSGDTDVDAVEADEANAANAPTGVLGVDEAEATDESSEDESAIDAVSNDVAGFFGGLVDALGAIGNAIGGFVSAAVDIGFSSVSTGFAAVTGKSLGHSFTGVSTAVSNGIEAAGQGLAGFFGGSTDNADPAGATADAPTGQNDDAPAGQTDADAVSSGGAEVGADAQADADQSGVSAPDQGDSGGFSNSFFPVAALAPRIQFFAEKEVLSVGESVTLTWNTANAVSCRALDAWSGEKELSGEQTIENVTESRVYTLSCQDSRNAFRSRSLFITVLDGLETTLPSFDDNEEVRKLVIETLAQSKGEPLPAPTLSLSVEPAVLASEQNATLRWSAKDAVVCVGGDDWPRAQGVSGSEKNYVPVSGQRTLFHVTVGGSFTLSCFSADGQRVVKRAVLQVTAPNSVGP